jgi:acyl carrier protein
MLKGGYASMNDGEILNKLEKIFHAVFNNKAIILTSQTSPNDIDEWDSLNQVVLVVAVQEEFRLKFTLEEMRLFIDVGSLVSIIKNKTATV